MKNGYVMLLIVALSVSCASPRRDHEVSELKLILKTYNDPSSTAAKQLLEMGRMHKLGNKSLGELALIRIAELQVSSPESLLFGSERDSSAEKRYYYGEALRSNPMSLEAVYGLAITSGPEEIQGLLNLWKARDVKNSLPFYLSCATAIDTNLPLALDQLKIGNLVGRIVYRPLYPRVAGHLSATGLRNAIAEFNTDVRHPQLRLITVHRKLAAYTIESDIMLHLLAFNNGIALSHPLSSVSFALGCSLGAGTLRAIAPEAPENNWVRSEATLRANLLERLHDDELPFALLTKMAGLLELSNQTLHSRILGLGNNN